ncbi:MAG: hypothetical protein H7834_11535 [Magnetococcus sp. YQC-9]
MTECPVCQLPVAGKEVICRRCGADLESVEMIDGTDQSLMGRVKGFLFEGWHLTSLKTIIVVLSLAVAGGLTYWSHSSAKEKRQIEERLATERRLAEEKAAAEKRQAEERAAREKTQSTVKAPAEKTAAEKAAAEKAAAEKAAAEKAAAEKAAAEKAAAEKAAAEKLPGLPGVGGIRLPG